MKAWLLLAAIASIVHASTSKPAGMSWQDWHMLEEHHVDVYDAPTFFKLHDLNDNGVWQDQDILNLYGLARDTVVGDGSGMGLHQHGLELVTEEAKRHVVKTVLELVDSNHDGSISAEEWAQFHSSGKQLPDFGYGQGHHLDFESEYEEHHWNKYHRDQDPEVLIKHKEDIEHELLHHEHEIEESHNHAPEIRKITQNFLSLPKLSNLPQKYSK